MSMKQRYYIFRNSMLAVSFLLLILFMMQILFQQEKKQVSSYRNIVVALDVSKSMLVSDLGSDMTRLTAAKQYIYDILSQHRGYSFWLTIFVGESQRVLPLTQDTELFATFVSWLDYRNITRQGTNISAALEDSLKSFSQDETGAIVLITDGDEDNIDISSDVIAHILQNNVSLYVVGIGSERGWYIPTGDMFAPYETFGGERVIARLNTEGLKRLASSGWWSYVVYPEILKLWEQDIQKQVWIHWENYSFLYLSFILWVSFCILICLEKYFPKILRRYEI